MGLCRRANNPLICNAHFYLLAYPDIFISFSFMYSVKLDFLGTPTAPDIFTFARSQREHGINQILSPQWPGDTGILPPEASGCIENATESSESSQASENGQVGSIERTGFSHNNSFLMGLMVVNWPAMQVDPGSILRFGRSSEEGITTHSSILTLRKLTY